LNDAARTINATAYGYISSWALLTAAELRVFDRLPAKSTDLAEAFPDADLVDTWMITLADADAGAVPNPTGGVLDLGGGWGAITQAIAKRHDVDVDVVDFDTVISSAPAGSERVRFLAGNALDASTWPDEQYDGVVLSHKFSSISGAEREPLLAELARRGVRWIAIHDFMAGTGRLADAWSLQHAQQCPVD
jgi:hypothetical protein